MSQTSYKNEHLVSNIDNSDENRSYVKTINKLAKDSKSKYRIKIKYRKPKDGKKYGWGGSLKKDNANAFSIYVEDKTPYTETAYHKQWNEISRLRVENESLKEKVSFYENPYNKWSDYEIHEEIESMKEDIFSRFIGNECRKEQQRDVVIKKYDQLVEALNYKKEGSK